MIQLIPDLPANTLGFEVSGPVTASDYETVLMPAVEKACAGGNKVRMLYYLTPAFEKFELGAMWEDAKVGLQHFSAWDRIAVVTDVDWIANSVRLFGFAIPADVKVFDNSGLAAAKSWLAE